MHRIVSLVWYMHAWNYIGVPRGGGWVHWKQNKMPIYSFFLRRDINSSRETKQAEQSLTHIVPLPTSLCPSRAGGGKPWWRGRLALQRACTTMCAATSTNCHPSARHPRLVEQHSWLDRGGSSMVDDTIWVVILGAMLDMYLYFSILV
jgi:hypothetical protein